MQTKDLDSLRPDLRNPRRMSDHDGKALSKSIELFGDLSGIVNNTQLDKVVGGHMRMETILAKDPAAKIYITEQLETPDPTGTTAWGYVIYSNRRLGYREVQWNEVKHGEANIAANRISGEFDLEKLGEYDQWLLDQGSDLTNTGQTADEVAHLLGHSVAPENTNDDPRTAMHLKLTDQQAPAIMQAIQLLKSQRNLQGEGNDDMDANALYYICLDFVANQNS